MKKLTTLYETQKLIPMLINVCHWTLFWTSINQPWNSQPVSLRLRMTLSFHVHLVFQMASFIWHFLIKILYSFLRCPMLLFFFQVQIFCSALHCQTLPVHSDVNFWVVTTLNVIAAHKNLSLYTINLCSLPDRMIWCLSVPLHILQPTKKVNRIPG